MTWNKCGARQRRGTHTTPAAAKRLCRESTWRARRGRQMISRTLASSFAMPSEEIMPCSIHCIAAAVTLRCATGRIQARGLEKVSRYRDSWQRREQRLRVLGADRGHSSLHERTGRAYPNEEGTGMPLTPTARPSRPPWLMQGPVHRGRIHSSNVARQKKPPTRRSAAIFEGVA